MISRIHLMVMTLLITADIAVAIAVYPRLPASCPTHWNLSGEPDAFGPPWKLAFTIPAINAGLSFFLWGIPLLGPFRANFERFRRTYGRFCVTVVAMIIAIHVVFLADAAGRELSIGRSMSIICGVMFTVMGNWLGKIRRNFYVGIRTPWTLVNEQVWERTHRAGGKIMVVIGLISISFGLFAEERVCSIAFFTGLAFLVAWSLTYSYVVYRKLGSRDEPTRNGGNVAQDN